MHGVRLEYQGAEQIETRAEADAEEGKVCVPHRGPPEHRILPVCPGDAAITEGDEVGWQIPAIDEAELSSAEKRKAYFDVTDRDLGADEPVELLIWVLSELEVG